MRRMTIIEEGKRKDIEMVEDTEEEIDEVGTEKEDAKEEKEAKSRNRHGYL